MNGYGSFRILIRKLKYIVSKAKIFKGKYWPKLEFPEGWGIQTKKNLHGGSIDFLEQTMPPQPNRCNLPPLPFPPHTHPIECLCPRIRITVIKEV